MTGRDLRPWWLAVAGSLLLHGGLLGGLSWQMVPWQLEPAPPPIEARLVQVPASPPPVAKPRSRLVPPPPSQAEPAVKAATPDGADATPDSSAVLPDESATEPVASSAEAAETVLSPLNSLPPRLDLRFQVRYGLARGEQTLLWINEGDRYTITSVASATGLAGMFYGGRFVQTSRGRITPHGLAPEEFWDQRGDKRSNARFDAINGSLTLTPADGAPRHFAYDGEPQDALSLFFHLALTAPPPDGLLAYTVFNGKKLRRYTYEVRGEEMLETGLGELRTLRLARLLDGDGRFEVWLAADRHYLPVRVLRSDDKGNEVELRVQSIAP